MLGRNWLQACPGFQTHIPVTLLNFLGSKEGGRRRGQPGAHLPRSVACRLPDRRSYFTRLCLSRIMAAEWARSSRRSCRGGGQRPAKGGHVRVQRCRSVVRPWSAAGRTDSRTRQAPGARAGGAPAGACLEQRVGVQRVDGHPVERRVAQHSHVQVPAGREGAAQGQAWRPTGRAGQASMALCAGDPTERMQPTAWPTRFRQPPSPPPARPAGPAHV